MRVVLASAFLIIKNKYKKILMVFYSFSSRKKMST
nr:MAG TPA: hypothetical protein [Caudoviricetes sp.]